MYNALEGLRIIDLTMGWAGPLATRNLADMGAQVIKVESCERFDWWRSWEATEAWIADNGAEKSPQYLSVNRNKLDITLDLEHPRGRELLLQLVATADGASIGHCGTLNPRGENRKYRGAITNDCAMVRAYIRGTQFGFRGPILREISPLQRILERSVKRGEYFTCLLCIMLILLV